MARSPNSYIAIIAFFTPLLTALAVLMWIEHLPQQVWHVAGVYFLVTTLLILFWLAHLLTALKWWLVLVLSGTTIYVTAIAYTLTLLVNLWLPPQTRHCYQGKIAETAQHRSGRGNSQYYTLSLDQQDEYGLPLKFSISERAYHKLQVGMPYEKCMQRGGLGLSYQLKW